MGKLSRRTIEAVVKAINSTGTLKGVQERTGLAVTSIDRYVRAAKGAGLLPQETRLEGDKFYPQFDHVIVGEYDEDGAVTYLSRRGYTVSRPERVTDTRIQLDLAPLKGEWYAIGVVSDTHLGSKYQQLTHLHAAYALMAERGITTVLHAGDLTDGQRVYRGQEFEIFCHGADAQVQYAIEHYPKYDGITTHLIGGNHDDSHWKLAGVDVCAAVAAERGDIIYHGMHGAYIEIHGVSIYLHHGSRGNSYARSYRSQRMIEQLAPAQKPNIFLMGHYHTQVILPMYRNVYGVQLPCFQSQTPYEKRNGLYPEVGFVILEFAVNNGGLARVRVETIPFFVPNEGDY